MADELEGLTVLDVGSIAPDFWTVAADLNAFLCYAGRTDEADRGSHWLPGQRRCYVYILSSGGIPVYIGKSFEPHNRFTMHRRREWWGEAEHLSVFQVIGQSRDDAGRRALRLESAAIRGMRPVYNVAGVIG